MKLRVKYCGGCNPVIDRRRLVQEVITLLRDKTPVEIVAAAADVGLLVGGCPVCCIDREELADQADRWITVAGSLVDYIQYLPDSLALAVVAKVLPD